MAHQTTESGAITKLGYISLVFPWFKKIPGMAVGYISGLSIFDGHSNAKKIPSKGNMAKIRLRLERLWHLVAGYFTHTVYQHHKGGLYRLLYVADESTNSRVGNRVVVYCSLADGIVYSILLRHEYERVLLPSGNRVTRFRGV